MKRLNCRENELCARVFERYQQHSQKPNTDNPVVIDEYKKMQDIDIYGLWTLSTGELKIQL